MGPSATQMLGDFGADIIKIERPGAGDIARNSFPDRGGQDNPIFLSINRNKRSLSVDTWQEEGRAVLRRIIAEADVVVSNFRNGAIERMGFGYEELSCENPRPDQKGTPQQWNELAILGRWPCRPGGAVAAIA